MREVLIVQESSFNNEHGKIILDVLKNVQSINKEDRIEFGTNIHINGGNITTQCFNQYLKYMDMNGTSKIIIQKT